MIVREMTTEDLPYVLEIENSSFSDPWTENMFRGLFDSEVYKNYVAVENNEILGYMSVIATFYVFEIMNIAVKGQARKQGVATLLMNKAKDVALSVGADRIFLEVRSSNLPAKNLYEKSGFTYDGVRRWYYTDGEDALLMSLKM